MEVATNGQQLSNCNDVVKSAMSMYWSSAKSTNLKWHFTKTGILEYLKHDDNKSKVMTRIASTKSKLPFVDGSSSPNRGV